MSDMISVVNHIESARLYGAALIGPSVYQGLPIPTLDDGAVRIGFLFSHAEILEPSAPLSIWAPKFLGLVDPFEGRLECIRATSPQSFGQKASLKKPIGTCPTPVQRLEDDALLTAQSRFCQAFDGILPSFLASAKAADPAVEAAMREFKSCFETVCEDALRPFYESLGRPFFHWLGE